MAGSSLKQDAEDILGFRVPPVDAPYLRRLWFLTMAQFVAFLITWICNYIILQSGWALYEDQPVLWVLQLLAIFQGWHIAGYLDRNPTEGRRLIPILFVALVNWVLAFVWIIQETVNCEKMESEDSAVMQQCNSPPARTPHSFFSKQSMSPCALALAF